MYSTKPSLVYGFHGCDKDIALRIVNHKIEFEHSHNDYDWLGDGIYFWENNHKRADDYAIQSMERANSKIKEPFALGAIIDLGNCFDLLDQKYLDFLKFAYDEFKVSIQKSNITMPYNTNFGKNDFDFKNRQLDCAVIRYARSLAEAAGECFDSVRAAFIEGDPLYEGAGFHKNNHIQIAILNPNCIKGIFLPRVKYPWPSI
jgi:hypothetical protein